MSRWCWRKMPDDDNTYVIGRETTEDGSGRSLGRIQLKQLRLSRSDAEPQPRVEGGAAARSSNPMNRLVPYLDLFVRLEDDELARLAAVEATIVAELRRQVVEIHRALERYCDLLPRLSDDELVRLTGATPKTIRFWRLCQPRSIPVLTGSSARAEPPAEPRVDSVVVRAPELARGCGSTEGPEPAAVASTDPGPAANAHELRIFTADAADEDEKADEYEDLVFTLE